MKRAGGFINAWVLDFFRFVRLLIGYFFRAYLARWFGGFESVKDVAVGKMYQQRGKYATIFVHAGVVTVMALGVALGPTLIVDTNQSRAVISSALGNRIVFAEEQSAAQVLGETVTASDIPTLTQISEKPRSEDEEYLVQNGDTLASIATKFGVSQETIQWDNPNVTNWKVIKVGQKLIIPPVTGVVHIVKSGETIYSIAKKYGSEPQAIVDFPFNSFTNDETFALAVGQRLVIPDGVMPKAVPVAVNVLARTPDAGTVTATGAWIWPAAGRITQPYRPWHKGIDIANHDGGPILAADAGTVIVSGWPDNSGYGNRVVINHGNGYITLYAHMSRLDVVAGQRVKRGDQLGMMGSTGRSTGTHLHFEIRTTNRGTLDPLAQLR